MWNCWLPVLNLIRTLGAFVIFRVKNFPEGMLFLLHALLSVQTVSKKKALVVIILFLHM